MREENQTANNRQQQDLQALRRACCDNAEALDFLCHWRGYVHDIDDLVDGDLKGAEGLLATFARAIGLYSHPFYLKHIAELRQVALNCTNAYADSVAWEASAEKWQREFADHYRHFGAEMVLAVLSICARERGLCPYRHMRSISLELRTVCYLEHHTPEGKAV